MPRRAFTYVEFAVVVALLIVLPAVYFAFFIGGHPTSPRSNCLSNLKQIGLGFAQYTQDANDRFPDVAGVGGWGEAVQPYIKTWRVFHCPSTNLTRDEQTTDYYMNARLSGVSTQKIEDSTISVLLAEGAAGQPLNYALPQLPAAWRPDESSPAWRHLKTGNYLFVDGHVKSIKVADITLDKPSAGKPTFLVK